MPELVIVVGVIFIHIALVLYSVFIYKERKYKRATNGVVGFITAAVLYFIIVLMVSRGFRFWEKHWLQHLYPHDAVKVKPKKGLANFRI